MAFQDLVCERMNSERRLNVSEEISTQETSHTNLTWMSLDVCENYKERKALLGLGEKVKHTNS
jgi:hypothetical protein